MPFTKWLSCMFIRAFRTGWTNASRWPSKKKFGKAPMPRQTHSNTGLKASNPGLIPTGRTIMTTEPLTQRRAQKSDPRLARLIRKTLGTNKWRYRKPQDRAKPSPHLKGFDLKKEKPFVWPEKFARWKKDFDRGLVSLAPEGTPMLKTMEPNEPTVRKSTFSRKRTMLYFHNLSQKSIILEGSISRETKTKQNFATATTRKSVPSLGTPGKSRTMKRG